MRRSAFGLVVGGTLMFGLALANAQAPQGAAPVIAPATGNATRGKALFEQTYRCYACHGYAGETGAPRLVPISRTEEAFMAYVRKPSGNGMPPFADVPAGDLSDVYAYLRSLKPTPPQVESLPILNDILQRVTKNR